MATEAEAKPSMPTLQETSPERPCGGSCVHIESVERIGHYPIVENAFDTATQCYNKVKTYTGIGNSALQKAEDIIYGAVEVVKPVCVPVVKKLEGPIKKVDGVVCNGLDFVEKKVPCVKQQPREVLLQLIENTREFVNNKLESAAEFVKPAVDTAHSIVDPLVQPALETASAVKEYGKHKVEEFLEREQKPEREDSDEESKKAV